MSGPIDAPRSTRPSRWSAATWASSPSSSPSTGPTARAALADMRAALAAGDAEDLRRAAHTLKGSSASLGANDLADACRDVETAARDGRLDGLGREGRRDRGGVRGRRRGARASGSGRRDERSRPTVGRILVVDDNPVDRALLVAVPGGEGHDADRGRQRRAGARAPARRRARRRPRPARPR